MKHHFISRKLFATALCFSLILGSTACKKKTVQDKRKREILETDTFFESEIFELALPIDETKTIDYKSFDSIQFLGDIILANYTIQYVMPDEPMTPESYESFDWNSYYKTGTAKFSLIGEYLGDLSTGIGMTEIIALDNDGNLAKLESVLNDNYELSGFKVLFQDDSGNTIKELPLEMPADRHMDYVFSMQFLPDGKIGIQDNYSAPICVYDQNGKYLFEINSMERGIIGKVFETQGKYYAFSIPVNFFDSFDILLHEIDLKTGEVKPGTKANAINDPSMLTFGDDGVYTTTPNGISKYDPVSGETKEILDWNQTDVSHSYLGSVMSFPENENEIHAIARQYSSNFIDDKFYVINLKRAEKNPHAGKKIMYVGGIGLSNGFYDFIYEYNADENNKTRIEATDYCYSLEDGTVNDEHFLTNLTSRINLMILSGEAPDILVNFAGYDQYANDDMLVDLNEYIDGKEGLDRSEYFDNIFRSMEVNGKLYYAPMTFYLKGYMANGKYIQPDTNWTFDDMDKAAASLPDGTELIPPVESTDLLKLFMGSDLSKYMDYANKKVSFNSEDMIKVLEEVKKYASKEDLSDRTFLLGTMSSSAYEGIVCYDTSGIDIGTKPIIQYGDYLRNGTSAMIESSLYNLNEYSLLQGLADGNGKYVGYPTLQGNGILSQPVESMAIVADSPYRDEAWDVIRNFYSSEAQSAMTRGVLGGLPMRLDVFEDNMKAEKETIDTAFKKYQKDLSKGEAFGAVVFPTEDGQIDELRELIKSVTHSYHTDEAVMDVIIEEVPGYFSDSRSAQEVLKNIDNRALLIVQER